MYAVSNTDYEMLVGLYERVTLVARSGPPPENTKEYNHWRQAGLRLKKLKNKKPIANKPCQREKTDRI